MGSNGLEWEFSNRLSLSFVYSLMVNFSLLYGNSNIVINNSLFKVIQSLSILLDVNNWMSATDCCL